MPYTYKELLKRLAQEEETSLLELLEITSEDIVARFEDLIEDRTDWLLDELDDERETDEL
jgi:hypothetical protein